nr:MAG TPA: hypothetical protein [Caudoviricetes sp.]
MQVERTCPWPNGSSCIRCRRPNRSRQGIGDSVFLKTAPRPPCAPP